MHQGSVLSLLLFIIVLEAIGCPWELLYADDLVISAESLDELARLEGWKTEMEAKGLKANLSKTKVMVSGPELNTLKEDRSHVQSAARV